VAGGEVGFLLEHVVILGGLRGVLDLADLRALGLVGDVLDLLPADVASSGIGAHRGADQRERPLDAGGQQHGRQESRIDERPGPLADPEHRVVGGVGAQLAPGLGDRNRPCGREGLAEPAVPFQRGGDRWVVGGTQHHRDVPWCQPSRRREVGGAKRRDESVHLLAQHGGSTAHPGARGPDLPSAGLHVQ